MEKDKKYFVILSTGEYSDYEPHYFMGDIPITQEELDKKSKEITDYLIAEYESFPERPATVSWYDREMERYDPITNERVPQPYFYTWFPLMEKWLVEEKGYEKLPDNIPEINY